MGSDKQLLNFAKCFNAESKELESVKDKFLLEEDVQIVEQQINPYYLEYNSFYTFNKILSNSNN